MDATSHTVISATIASAVATHAGVTIDTPTFVNYLLFQFLRESGRRSRAHVFSLLNKHKFRLLMLKTTPCSHCVAVKPVSEVRFHQFINTKVLWRQAYAHVCYCTWLTLILKSSFLRF